MTRALSLYRKHSSEELLQMQSEISAEPTNLNADGGIHLYTPGARRKLSDIAWAITQHLDDKRVAAGNPVVTAGYSGRKSRRRR